MNKQKAIFVVLNIWLQSRILVQIVGAVKGAELAICRCADPGADIDGEATGRIAYLGSDGIWVLPMSDPSCVESFIEKHEDVYQYRQRRPHGRMVEDSTASLRKHPMRVKLQSQVRTEYFDDNRHSV
jgi:hypothetical protein